MDNVVIDPYRLVDGYRLVDAYGLVCILLIINYYYYKLLNEFIFGYSPNVTVGSCAAWAFGEETKNIVTKPTAKSFLKHWENVFSLKEGIW